MQSWRDSGPQAIVAMVGGRVCRSGTSGGRAGGVLHLHAVELMEALGVVIKDHPPTGVHLDGILEVVVQGKRAVRLKDVGLVIEDEMVGQPSRPGAIARSGHCTDEGPVCVCHVPALRVGAPFTRPCCQPAGFEGQIDISAKIIW